MSRVPAWLPKPIAGIISQDNAMGGEIRKGLRNSRAKEAVVSGAYTAVGLAAAADGVLVGAPVRACSSVYDLLCNTFSVPNTVLVALAGAAPVVMSWYQTRFGTGPVQGAVEGIAVAASVFGAERFSNAHGLDPATTFFVSAFAALVAGCVATKPGRDLVRALTKEIVDGPQHGRSRTH